MGCNNFQVILPTMAMHDMSVADAAKLLQMGRNAVVTRFKKLYGCNPSDYNNLFKDPAVKADITSYICEDGYQLKDQRLFLYHELTFKDVTHLGTIYPRPLRDDAKLLALKVLRNEGIIVNPSILHTLEHYSRMFVGAYKGGSYAVIILVDDGRTAIDLPRKMSTFVSYTAVASMKHLFESPV